MRRFPLAAGLTTLALAVGACGGNGDEADARPSAEAGPDATATAAETEATAAARVSVKTIAQGLDVPWGIGFLPDGSALVAERTSGEVVRIGSDGGKPRTVAKIPGVKTDAGEGGLLGLAVSPTFRRDRLVYVYFTTDRDNRVARFRLGSSDVTPILTGLKAAGIHNGGRIAFGPDRKLYATVGDAGDTSNAQDPNSNNGKILRMNPDGSRPSDNPFDGSLVYTLGHRNPQGIAWDAKGRMYSAELGQDRFDEVNRIRAGRNYGWPVVEGRGSTQGGKYTNPLKTWPTDQASPSGIAIRGGVLYMTALRGERLYRMAIRKDGSLGPDRALFTGRWGRLRSVVAVRGGRGLWLATSNQDGRGAPRSGDDRIFRIPAS